MLTLASGEKPLQPHVMHHSAHVMCHLSHVTSWVGMSQTFYGSR